jgi:hypothetical protein
MVATLLSGVSRGTIKIRKTRKQENSMKRRPGTVSPVFLLSLFIFYRHGIVTTPSFHEPAPM